MSTLGKREREALARIEKEREKREKEKTARDAKERLRDKELGRRLKLWEKREKKYGCCGHDGCFTREIAC